MATMVPPLTATMMLLALVLVLLGTMATGQENGGVLAPTRDDGFGTDVVDADTGKALEGASASGNETVEEEKGREETALTDLKVWSYAKGGDDWQEGECLVGRRQSPININTTEAGAGVVDATGRNLMHFNYSRGTDMSMVFNGHTLAVTGDLGAVELGCSCQKERYEVMAFHFHAPSGHTLDADAAKNATGKFPLEMRIVHQRVGATAKNDLLILALLFQTDDGRPEDEDNAFLETIDWENAPSSRGVVHKIGHDVDLNSFSAELNGDFYAYDGSLATPTCDETVEWRVLAAHPHVSKKQVAYVRSVLNANEGDNTVNGNSRKTQPLNGRKVVKYHRTTSDCHTHPAGGAGSCCASHCACEQQQQQPKPKPCCCSS